LASNAGEHGPYEIQGLSGQGGMGVVYGAVQPSLDREVALKVLPLAQVTNAQAKERFEREGCLDSIGKLFSPSVSHRAP